MTAQANVRTPREGAIWDDRRCAELKLLAELVREAGSLDSGNRVLWRIARCIEIAALLSRTDWDTGRRSLLQFLDELAIADRFGSQP